ncbi:MAG: glycoside hydrolase family 66 protein [Paenibacillus sp.]|uniref:glycoside hydrolase family 66 protein n=1 Tax=Paenibacillus sp. TaxID=58172 RepID=UPI002901D8EB|nr:glycoside hydrolase family 66 protein [Paenibacillus sp.]MDU2243464.1 glycoside hydrolase family 66 protein [Paenibacillus sp.]
MIKDIYPVRAQFLSGQPVEIAVELVNDAVEFKRVTLSFKVNWLDREVNRTELRDIALAPNEERVVQVNLGEYTADFKGYGVDLEWAADGGGDAPAGSVSTSFDVVSDWRKSTRYGFLSDFHTKDKGDQRDVAWLSKLHINLVQFYDWMYKHDDLVPETNEFTDLMGRELNLDVVSEKVGYCHEYGMKAIAYGAVYAASKAFYEEHKDWALLQSDGEAYDFIDVFKIMNIAAQSPWHDHIIGQYKRAIELVDFDGIHMDTYGFPKSGISAIDGSLVRLEEHFPVLIDHTREALKLNKEDICLIFNNVGNWPVHTVARASEDAVYIEVWKPYERYHHLVQIIQWAKQWGGGKPVILAAYLAPFRLESEAIERAEQGALLMTAAIAAQGGYHLLVGEDGGVLTQAYYADYSTMGNRFIRKLRDYYDFNIRYANLLYDNRLADVSMTHADGDNLEYVFENVEYSTYGEPGKVWTIIRENESFKTISFINLSNNAEDYWNAGKNRPSILEGIKVKVLLDREPRAAFVASPDLDHGRPQPLEFELTRSLRGITLEAVIPALEVWNLLTVEL